MLILTLGFIKHIYITELLYTYLCLLLLDQQIRPKKGEM